MFVQSRSKLLPHHQFYEFQSIEHPQNRIHRITRSIMGVSKSRKAKKVPKRPATSPPPSDVKKCSNTVVKRIKVAKFVDPDTIGQETDKNSENSTEDDDDDKLVMVDVSNMVYTLSQTCMIGDEPVLKDTNFLKLGEFSYRQFDMLSSRKLFKLSETGKWDPEWVSGQAIVSCKSLPIREWLKVPVEDENSWEKVECCIRMFMENLKNEIKVKLTVLYKKKSSTGAVNLEDEDGDAKKVFNVKVTLILGSKKMHRKAVGWTQTTSRSGCSARQCIDG